LFSCGKNDRYVTKITANTHERPQERFYPVIMGTTGRLFLATSLEKNIFLLLVLQQLIFDIAQGDHASKALLNGRSL
jgi:hypothetical protein